MGIIGFNIKLLFRQLLPLKYKYYSNTYYYKNIIFLDLYLLFILYYLYSNRIYNLFVNTQNYFISFCDNSYNIIINNTNPLDQFDIKDLISLNILQTFNISLTNIGLYLIFSSILISSLFLISNNYEKITSNHWSSGQESLYATVHNIVISQINDRKGQLYFPFIFVIFIFILSNNLIGMVPYSFASTSHFVFTFSLSFTIVLGATILGFFFHKLKLFSLFVPSGCPLPLLVLLVLIEFISYLSRNVSLGLRLAANIMAGHMLLNILSGFTYNIMNTGIIYFFLALLPLSFIIAFSSLELAIAFIQAQVFIVLSCSYIKDGLELH